MPIGKTKAILIILLSLYLIANGLYNLMTDKKSQTDWSKYDLLGMLETITNHNESLGNTNHEIVSKMGEIDQQVGKTGEVADKLAEVKRGLVSQNQTLTKLTPVTADQVELSTNLRSLSGNIKDSMRLILHTSQRQSKEIQRMNQVVSSAKAQLEQVADENKRINAQLHTADEKSKQIENSIP